MTGKLVDAKESEREREAPHRRSMQQTSSDAPKERSGLSDK